MKLLQTSVALVGLTLCATPALAQTPATCISMADHVLTVLDNTPGSETAVEISLEAYRDAQIAHLDEQIVEAAARYGMDADTLRAQSTQERELMGQQFVTRYGTETLYMDYVQMLLACGRTAPEGTLGQTPEQLGITLTAIRDMIN